jgi:proline iminopeptidase
MDAGNASAPAAALYPPLEPYASGFLKVDAGHALYWETCGNPHGMPALFLHGGPGGGCSAYNRRFFDPARYRIVLLDQRGCGRSTPSGLLESNTTGHLVEDIESLRKMLNVGKWLLFGGSWGTTLALAYAQQHPQRISAMVLRGVFTARQSEFDWLYRGGASNIFPEAWLRFTGFIPKNEHADLISAYHARLISGDAALEAAAARAWCEWEDTLSTFMPVPMSSSETAMLALARIETHYFMHHAFLQEGGLLADTGHLKNIPGIIVQGRYDMVTPASTAWDLHRCWRGSALRIVPAAGHASSESGITRELIFATDALYTQIAG